MAEGTHRRCGSFRRHSVRVQYLNSLYVRPTDKLRLIEYQEDTWIALTDKTGEDVLRLYKVQPNQLADLHALIGRKLGLAPAATMNQLYRMRDFLDVILKRHESEQVVPVAEPVNG